MLVERLGHVGDVALLDERHGFVRSRRCRAVSVNGGDAESDDRLDVELVYSMITASLTIFVDDVEKLFHLGDRLALASGKLECRRVAEGLQVDVVVDASEC